ncbi:MAG: FliA/WhiG family RNA polymerase sigma factor [Planctomycetes bacterium]|nr:FliA/WhiG family RNA polymerase sigma factor [Planctomycetota bacterium]
MAPKKSASAAQTKKPATVKSHKARAPAQRASDAPPAALPKGRKPHKSAARAEPKAVKPHPKPAPAPAPKPVAAKPKKEAPKPKEKLRPTVDELRVTPTDDIWVHYRGAVRQTPRDEVWLEQLRNVLMELHYPLVKHIAERLLQTLPKSIELDDLVSAGLFGLMDAIRGFDPERGIKFKTYCTTRIRGSILDQLRSQDWVPRLVRLKAGRIEKMLQKLQGEYGREPTHAELAQALKMDHSELSAEMSQSHAKTMFSLSERWDDRDDDNPMEKVEIVEDKSAVDPIGELNRRDLMIYITKSLTHKERFIIEQYYQVGHTMREIGEMLALTESRVCQIHSNVMSRLKGLLSPKSNNLIT